MATYYVRPLNGSDSATGLSFALAKKTLQAAADLAVAGDSIRCCDEAVETPTATIDFDTNAGTSGSPILVQGASAAAGAVDGSIYQISGARIANGVILNVTVAYVVFQNIQQITGATSTVTAGDVIDLARELIADAKVAYRWKDAAMFLFLTAALRKLESDRPDALLSSDFLTITAVNEIESRATTIPFPARYKEQLAAYVAEMAMSVNNPDKMNREAAEAFRKKFERLGAGNG